MSAENIPVGQAATSAPGAARKRSFSLTGSKRRGELLTLVSATLLVMLFAAIILLPVAWMLSTALKTRIEVAQFPPRWIPADPQWQNFPDALTFLPFNLYFRNTAIITAIVLVGDVLMNSIFGYAFARLRAPGKELLFVLIISTMMVPYQVLMVPQYVLFHRLGWVDTIRPLTIPAWFGSAFLIFLLRQFYRGIPTELDDASRIDGCGYISTWWRIMVPLSKPALAAAAIFSFTYNWNDFTAPLIYLNSPDKMTVAVGLASFRHRYGATPWNLLMAASLVAVLPCVLLFFVAQRYFIQGIVVTGVKG
jgi:ABC-type glycerol-3-phosphate transport system permease component